MQQQRQEFHVWASYAGDLETNDIYRAGVCFSIKHDEHVEANLHWICKLYLAKPCALFDCKNVCVASCSGVVSMAVALHNWNSDIDIMSLS